MSSSPGRFDGKVVLIAGASARDRARLEEVAASADGEVHGSIEVVDAGMTAG